MIIDFGQNLGQRSPLINSSDKKNDDCGISAAPSEIPCLRRLRRDEPAAAVTASPTGTDRASGD
jgi:hypothetical protein